MQLSKYESLNIYFLFFNLLLSDIIIVPDDYDSIQGAIDLSANGDTIQVKPGIYYENLIINEKFLVIQSFNFNEETIIDGNFKNPVITCNNIQEREIIIEALKNAHGNMAKAARLLGTTSRIFTYRCQRLDILSKQYKN